MPGVPAWGAVAIAAGLTFLGFLVDAARGTELTGAFAFLYVLGCIAAVVLVRYRGLFTAMVQAPLILFVAVPLAYQYFTEDAGTGLKDIILNVAIPLVNRFPLMLLGTAVAVGLGVLRIVLKRQNTHAPAVRRNKKPSEDKPGRAQRRAQAERPERPRRRTDPADRSPVSATEATDIVSEPYVGRSSAASRPRTGTDRRSTTPTPSPQPRFSPTDSPRPDYARPERQKPDYQRPQYPQSRQPQRAQPAEPRYSSEPRRERSARVQPPREVADPYSTGARPVVAPGTSSSAADNPRGTHSLPTPHRDDIPPHPVPKVRYRDRRTD